MNVLNISKHNSFIYQLVDQHCTAILEEPKKESQLPRLRVICVKRMKIELWLQIHCLIWGIWGAISLLVLDVSLSNLASL